jgi:acyl-CoA synthetase (AMP-forming)/AMP-acid ligase II
MSSTSDKARRCLAWKYGCSTCRRRALRSPPVVKASHIGPSVFLGYWQAPEATEAAMVDGWVRTGDLARIDRDGNIYLTGDRSRSSS